MRNKGKKVRPKFHLWRQSINAEDSLFAKIQCTLLKMQQIEVIWKANSVCCMVTSYNVIGFAPTIILPTMCIRNSSKLFTRSSIIITFERWRWYIVCNQCNQFSKWFVMSRWIPIRIGYISVSQIKKCVRLAMSNKKCCVQHYKLTSKSSYRKKFCVQPDVKMKFLIAHETRIVCWT